MCLLLLQRLLTFARRAQGVRDPVKHSIQMNCICYTALAGLQPACKDNQNRTNRSDEVAAKTQQLAQAVLDVSSSSAALQRAASQLFGCAVQLGSDAFAVR